MQIDESLISAKIYHRTAQGVLYAKVDFPDIGYYMNSITVRSSEKNKNNLWVQAPAIPYRGKFIKPNEFESDSPLWSLIEDAVLRAVEEYNHPP